MANEDELVFYYEVVVYAVSIKSLEARVTTLCDTYYSRLLEQAYSNVYRWQTFIVTAITNP